MSSCSTPWCAEYASWQIAARIPASLQAATEAPTPEPQTKTPRSASPSENGLADLARLVRIVDPGRIRVGTQVDARSARRARRALRREMDATVVECDRDVHVGPYPTGGRGRAALLE